MNDGAAVDGAIRATFDEFAAAWNAHDAARMAACWVDEGNAVDPWGKLAVGRHGVEQLLAEEHEAPMRESSYRILQLATRSLSEHAAVVECEATIDNVRAPNGRHYELKHRLDGVAVVRDGAWRFLSLHPSLK